MRHPLDRCIDIALWNSYKIIVFRLVLSYTPVVRNEPKQRNYYATISSHCFQSRRIKNLRLMLFIVLCRFSESISDVSRSNILWLVHSSSLKFGYSNKILNSSEFNFQLKYSSKRHIDSVIIVAIIIRFHNSTERYQLWISYWIKFIKSTINNCLL